MKISKDKLYKRYILDKASTVDIAKEYQCEPGSIRYLLKKYNIPIRNICESHTTSNRYINLDLDIIYGSLLGDASLLKKNKTSQLCLPIFSKSNKYLDHVEYVAKHIYPTNYQDRIKPDQTIYFKFTTLHHIELKHIYEKWYPERNNFVKLVPRDLKLNGKIVLNWFLDDGCSIYRQDTFNQQPRIFLSTESFTKSDNEFLISELTRLNISGSLRKVPAGFGYKLEILANSINEFYDCIGECPVSSLSYKWKRRC